ncbi:hypothetical protein I309_00290 [Cryptococcus deuterogattii LA55]|nr:hypothetical protein I309_00290 [Cryptococcus deuterogattii LA55]KIR35596.1 hypothetical protein I352_01872 [Cryptococcus deuterogattii MMRL2647]KIR72848.1 hypothetical protein I310_03451 [Cryptococcus deuterogattii CA1014]KIR94971.1 hypothetical protein I304_01296 [Cryptococcus deuterogattii CBS 10090]
MYTIMAMRPENPYPTKIRGKVRSGLCLSHPKPTFFQSRFQTQTWSLVRVQGLDHENGLKLKSPLRIISS